ncbi:hypothetical protein GYB29_10650 [bacterium]|nr:hypothetical protein [bacterium]
MKKESLLIISVALLFVVLNSIQGCTVLKKGRNNYATDVLGFQYISLTKTKEEKMNTRFAKKDFDAEFLVQAFAPFSNKHETSFAHKFYFDTTFRALPAYYIANQTKVDSNGGYGLREYCSSNRIFGTMLHLSFPGALFNDSMYVSPQILADYDSFFFEKGGTLSWNKDDNNQNGILVIAMAVYEIQDSSVQRKLGKTKRVGLWTEDDGIYTIHTDLLDQFPDSTFVEFEVQRINYKMGSSGNKKIKMIAYSTSSSLPLEVRK